MYVATVEHSEVYLNGFHVTRADLGKKWARGCVAYYPPGTDLEVLEGLMQAGDDAWTGRQGGSPSYTLRPQKNATFRFVPFSSWGVEQEDAQKGIDEIGELITACSELEGGASRSAAGTAGKLARKLIPREKMHQLAPQWRTLAHSAIHQGPTVVLRGGCADGIEWDRIGAFLQGMRSPVPVAWIPWHDTDWSYVEELPDEGIARATCYLDPDRWAGRLPPLPVRTSGGTIYPVGYVSGVWTLGLLRDAAAMGAEVEHIDEVALAACEPIHARVADRIDAIKHPGLRKMLYTRYWGRLAFAGGWKGTIEKQADTDVKIGTSALWWRWDGRTLGGTCPPDYRPDQAAFIAAHNHRAVNREADRLPPDALVAAHVDALWIDASIAHDIDPAPDGWKIKGRGPLRWYATGTYTHAGEHHAQGCPGKIDDARMTEWVAGGLRDGAEWVRRWNPLGGSAKTDPGAISDPPEHGPRHHVGRPLRIPSVLDDDEWINGWPRSEELRTTLESMTVMDIW